MSQVTTSHDGRELHCIPGTITNWHIWPYATSPTIFATFGTKWDKVSLSFSVERAEEIITELQTAVDKIRS